VLVLLNLIIRTGPDVAPAGFWNAQIAMFVANAVLSPGKLGFSLRDAEVSKSLPSCTFELMEAITKSKHVQLNKTIDTGMKTVLELPDTDLRAVFRRVLDPHGSLHLVQSLASGYQQLHVGGKLEAALKLRGSTVNELADTLLDTIWAWCDYPGQSPLSQTVCTEVFALILGLRISRSRLIGCLNDDSGAGHDAPGMETATDHVAPDSTDGNTHRRVATRSEIFHRKFGTQIHEYCARHAAHMIPELMGAASQNRVVMLTLQGTLDYIRSCTGNPTWGSLKTMKAAACNAACSSFESMNFLWGGNSTQETKLDALALLFDCLSLAVDGAVPAMNDTDVRAVLEVAGLEGVFRLLNSTLSTVNEKLTLARKMHAIRLLRFVANFAPESQSFSAVFDRESGSLRSGLMSQFPMQSSKCKPGTPEHREYEVALTALLDGAALSGSWPLLDMIIEVTCRDVLSSGENGTNSRHIFLPLIQDKLRDFVAQPAATLDALVTRTLLNVFKLTSKEVSPGLPSKFRAAILNQILLPMLESATESRVRTFFQQTVKQIVDQVEMLKDLQDKGKMMRGLKSDLLTETRSAISMVEVMFLRLPKNDLRDPGAIEVAYCKATSAAPEKVLLSLLVKVLKGALPSPFSVAGGGGGAAAAAAPGTPEVLLQEEHRALRCVAYNALSKVIACTQNDAKFFVSLLLKPIGESIVDLNRPYAFDNEPTTTNHRRSYFGVYTDPENVQTSSKAGFLSSQILSGSSLAGTVAIAVGSQSQVSDNSMDVDDKETLAESSAAAAVEGAENDLFGMSFEDDAMNRHECMGRLLTTVDLCHRFTGKVDSVDMPKWMQTLHDKFSNIDVEVNVKLFVGKVLLNRSAVFQPWCKYWYLPILNLLILMTNPNGLHKWPFNYYVADMCVVMLEWSEHAIPDAKDARKVQELLKVLVQACARTEEPKHMKNNAKILKTLIEKWGTMITGVSCTVLFRQLQTAGSSADGTDKNVLCGIYLLAAIASSGLPPYYIPDASSDATPNKFYAALVQHLRAKSSTIYKPTASCIGAVLQALSGNPEERQIVCDILMGTLKGLKKEKGADVDGKVLWCLHNACDASSGYPGFLDDDDYYWLKQVFDMLPRVVGEFQTMALRLVYWRAEVRGDDILRELKGKNMIPVLMKNSDSELQMLFLQTLGALSVCVSLDQVATHLTNLKTVFGEHRDEQCRKQYFAIAALLHDRASKTADPKVMALDTALKDAALATITNNALKILREGLSDESSEVRTLILEHWAKPSILGNDPSERLVSVFATLYHHDAEPEFLSTATFALLDLCKSAPEYTEALFDKPLEDCEWTDLSIDYGWQSRNDHMAPLFAATQFGSMSMDGTFVNGPSSSQTQQPGIRQQGFVRATQEAGGGRFAQTQSLATGALASFASYQTQTQSISEDTLFHRKRKSGGGSQSMSSQSDDGSSQSQSMHTRELKLLRRQFVRGSRPSASGGGGARSASGGRSSTSQPNNEKSLTIARVVDQKRKRDQQEESKRKRARLNVVQMQRNYRAGELPDVQIQHAELIKPLQALALKDVAVAQLLFSGLFRGVYDALGERKDAEAKLKIAESLASVIKPEGPVHASFTTAVLDLCIHVDAIDALPHDIATRSMASGAFHAGVLLLENILATQKISDGGGRRGGPDATALAENAAKLVPYWVELAKLYRALDERDIAQGIFGSSLSACEADAQRMLDQTQLTLDLESQGSLSEASAKYDELIQHDGSNTPEGLVQFWKDAQVGVSEKLCQWDVANSQLLKAAGFGGVEDDESWTRAFWNNQQAVDGQLRPLMFASTQLFLEDKTNTGLGESASGDQLHKFIEAGLELPNRRQLLTDKHADLLSLIFTKKGSVDTKNLGLARGFAEQAVQNFASQWPLMHPLMRSSRRAALQTLQPLIESQEYLALVGSETPTESQAVRLLEQWGKRAPRSRTDELSVWQCMGSVRLVLIDGIESALGEITHADTASALTRGRVHTLLVRAEEAALQRNDLLAGQSIKGAYEFIGKLDKESDLYNELAFEWSCVRSQNQFLDANRRLEITMDTKGSEQALIKVASAVYIANNYVEAVHATEPGRAKIMDNADIRVQLLSVLSSGLWCLSKVLSTSIFEEQKPLSEFGLNKLLKKTDNHLEKVFPEARTKTPQELAKMARNRCLSSLLQATSPKAGWERRHAESEKGFFEYAPTDSMMTDDGEDGTATEVRCNPPPINTRRLGASTMKELMDANVTLAQFADSLLQEGEDATDLSWTSNTGEENLVDLRSIMIEHALQGMRFGSSEAQQLLPKLLRFIGEGTAGVDPLSERFVANAAQVPCWVFLAWLPQMISLLDTPKAKWLHGIISAIATEYPNALVLPMTISVPGLKFPNKNQKQDQEFAERMQKELSFEPLSTLMWELERLSHPAMILSDWRQGELQGFLDNKSKDAKVCKELSRDLNERLLEDRGGAKPGSIIKEWRRKNGSDLTKALGINGKNLMTDKQIKNNIAKIHGDLRLAKTTTKLNDYSPWMSEFQSSNFPRTIELPGQYDGKHKPRPETHAKIDSFDSRVLVLASMRKPKRITVRCNDGRSFKLLVKGGEDLRLDQRVEQVFEVMNAAMAQDPDCSRRKLNLRTYQVMPMTDRIGMIEWVDNTIVLKDMMDSLGIRTLPADVAPVETASGSIGGGKTSARGPVSSKKKPATAPAKVAPVGSEAARKHKDWIDKFKGKTQGQQYGLMIKSTNRDAVQREWDAKIALCPQYSTLQVALQKLSSGPEAYLTLKNGFIRSLATLNICQYVLGIGDRHLSNTMVDSTTGELVGIDFGHAFGSATELLPVPELMPFRLSPQLVKVMEPHGTSGLFRSSMMHVVRTMRDNKDLLLATTEVFINEPLLDWELRAKKEIRNGSYGNVDEDDIVDTYSTNKLDTIKQKLEGRNPVAMTKDLINANANIKGDSTLLSKCSAILDDRRVYKHDGKAGLEAEQCKTIYDQVDILLDIATDPNILGRTWVGWAPWL
jgi:DNA-dependent protein kinase catalytic subunit